MNLVESQGVLTAVCGADDARTTYQAIATIKFVRTSLPQGLCCR